MRVSSASKREGHAGAGDTTEGAAGATAAPRLAARPPIMLPIGQALPPAEDDEDLPTFNSPELELLQRLYAAAEEALSAKDLAMVEVVAPNPRHTTPLTREAFMRTERDYWQRQNLDAHILFWQVKAEQLERYLKPSAEKRSGKMLSFEELQQRMSLRLRTLMKETLQLFIEQNLSKRGRWVKTPNATAAGANLDYLPFTSADTSTLSTALQTTIKEFQENLSAVLNRNILRIPDAYLSLDNFPSSDLMVIDPLALPTLSSREKVRRHHLSSHTSLRIAELRASYLAKIAEHPAELDAEIAKVGLELTRLQALLPSQSGAVSYLDPSLIDEAAKERCMEQQKAQDDFLIQKALHTALTAQKELCPCLSYDEEGDLTPSSLDKDKTSPLCDPLTTTELRYRMLASLDNILARERKKFEEYCTLCLGMVPDTDPASGLVEWKPITDKPAFNRYLDRFCAELRSSLLPLWREWNQWDIADPDLCAISPTQTEEIRVIIQKKLTEIRAQITKLEAQRVKIEEKLARSARLKARLSEEERIQTENKKSRFNILLGAYLDDYKRAREASPAPDFLYHAGRTLKLYSCPTVLAHYFPGTRLSRLNLLIEEGIPSRSCYAPRRSANLLHLALSHKAEAYDANLVMIVQYLLKRGVDAWQFNEDGLSPGAVVRHLIDSPSPARDMSWLKFARQIDSLCAEAAVLMEQQEEFELLQTEVRKLVDEGRALIAAEDARAVEYKSLSPLARFMWSTPVSVLPYEDALCSAQSSLFGLFEMLRLPEERSFGLSSGSEFTRKFNILLRHFKAKPVIANALARLELLRGDYDRRLAPQVQQFRAYLSADVSAMRRELDQARREAAAADARAAEALASLGLLRRQFAGLLATLGRTEGFDELAAAAPPTTSPTTGAGAR